MEATVTFVNATKIYQIKAKDSEVKPNPLCLGSTSKDFTANNMIKTELHRYVYDFSIDYNTSDIRDINNIHKYLIKKT